MYLSRYLGLREDRMFQWIIRFIFRLSFKCCETQVAGQWQNFGGFCGGPDCWMNLSDGWALLGAWTHFSASDRTASGEKSETRLGQKILCWFEYLDRICFWASLLILLINSSWLFAHTPFARGLFGRKTISICKCGCWFGQQLLLQPLTYCAP